MNTSTKDTLFFGLIALCLGYFINIAVSVCSGSEGDCEVSGYDGKYCLSDDFELSCMYCGDIYEYDCDNCDCVISDAALAGIIIGSVVGLIAFIGCIWACCKAQCCSCCCCNQYHNRV